MFLDMTAALVKEIKTDAPITVGEFMTNIYKSHPSPKDWWVAISCSKEELLEYKAMRSGRNGMAMLWPCSPNPCGSSKQSECKICMEADIHEWLNKAFLEGYKGLCGIDLKPFVSKPVKKTKKKQQKEVHVTIGPNDKIVDALKANPNCTHLNGLPVVRYL